MPQFLKLLLLSRRVSSPQIQNKIRTLSSICLAPAQISSSKYKFNKISHNSRHFHSSTCNFGRYEPDYLNPVGPQISEYDLINIQIKGFDYTILEEFGKFIHNSAERFGLDVEDAWGIPGQKLKITKLRHESTTIDTEYQLQVYERNIQIANGLSTRVPLFIDIIHSSLPVGVTLSVHPHFQEHEELRYIPDFQLKQLRTQLEEVGSDKKKSKKKT